MKVKRIDRKHRTTNSEVSVPVTYLLTHALRYIIVPNKLAPFDAKQHTQTPLQGQVLEVHRS